MQTKALIVMALWTIVLVGIMNFIGFNEHYREPIWTIGGAIFLLVILVGNVWIFFAIAKETPWKWFKNT